MFCIVPFYPVRMLGWSVIVTIEFIFLIVDVIFWNKYACTFGIFHVYEPVLCEWVFFLLCLT